MKENSRLLLVRIFDFVFLPFENSFLLFRQSSIEKVQKGDNIQVHDDVFLVQGSVLEVKLDGLKRDVIEAPAHLGPRTSQFVCLSLTARMARIPSFTKSQGVEAINFAHRSLSALHRPSFKRLSQRLVCLLDQCKLCLPKCSILQFLWVMYSSCTSYRICPGSCLKLKTGKDLVSVRIENEMILDQIFFAGSTGTIKQGFVRYSRK